MINRKNRIEELLKQLEEANEAYYNDSESIMTDEHFDLLKDELKELAPNHKFISQVGQKIKVSEWKKAQHKISMTSLNKCNTTEEFKKWALEIKEKYFVLEDKLDGASIDLEYENGKLVKAITRGDGVEGEDIFQNVRKMQNVRTEISGFTGSLRGEIFLFANDFTKINKILESEGGRLLSNPRNGAVGTCKRYDGKFSEYLSILYYDLAGIDFKTEFEKIEFIQNAFRLDTSFCKRVTLNEAIKLYEEYEEKLRIETKYDIDGLVIKCDDIELQKELGLLGSNPKGQIAWKFSAITKETTLLNVTWQAGNTRRITPVANFKEVNIGVKITNASLHNYDNFRKLALGKGDTILISRRNDVIPYLEMVIETKGNILLAPTKCPACGAELEIDGKYLICPNDNCKALITGSLEKWIYGLGIMDIGIKIIDALYNAGKISEPADFYKLKVSDIANLEGLGERSANKILKHLSEKKELTLPEFIGNLNMLNFSTSRVELLVESGYDSIDKILAAKESDLIQIKGIEAKTADKIVKGLQSKKKVIENLLSVGITIKQIVKKQAKTNVLSGKSFCFTGAINRCDSKGSRFTRGMMEELVVENGGTVDSVKRGLTALVQADPNSVSSKSQKAKDLGVKILSEVDFFKMIGM